MNLKDKMLQADAYLHDAMRGMRAMATLHNDHSELIEQIMADIESARSFLQDNSMEEVTLEDIFNVLEEEEPPITKPQFSPDCEHYMNERDMETWADDDVYIEPDGTSEQSELQRTLVKIQDTLENVSATPTDLATLYQNLTAADVAMMSPPERAAYDAWLQAVSAANAMLPPNPYQTGNQRDMMAAQAIQFQQQQAAAAAAQQQAAYEAQMKAIQEQQKAAAEAQRKAQEEARRKAEAEAARKAEMARRAEEQRKAAEAARQAEITKKQLEVAKAQGANAFVMPSMEDIKAQQISQTKIPDSFDIDIPLDDFDIEYIPFSIAEFDITRNGGTSSMYMECMRRDIGEWNIPSLLEEDALEVRDFIVIGHLADGTDVSINWSDENSIVASSVPAIHGTGALIEARLNRGQSIANITSVSQNNAIIDNAFAANAKEALQYMPAMDVSYIALEIEHEDLFFTLWFADGASDIEVQWIQEADIVSEDLAKLAHTLSMTLGVYAEESTGVPRERKLDKRTAAGRFHDRPEQYVEAQNRAYMEGHIVMNLKSITIEEDGKTRIRSYGARN